MREGPRVDSPRALRRCQENLMPRRRLARASIAGRPPHIAGGAGATARSRLDDDGPGEVRVASRRMVRAVIRERARLRERMRERRTRRGRGVTVRVGGLAGRQHVAGVEQTRLIADQVVNRRTCVGPADRLPYLDRYALWTEAVVLDRHVMRTRHGRGWIVVAISPRRRATAGQCHSQAAECHKMCEPH